MLFIKLIKSFSICLFKSMNIIGAYITIQVLETRHFERENTRRAKESIFYCIVTVYNL